MVMWYAQVAFTVDLYQSWMTVSSAVPDTYSLSDIIWRLLFVVSTPSGEVNDQSDICGQYLCVRWCNTSG